MLTSALKQLKRAFRNASYSVSACLKFVFFFTFRRIIREQYLGELLSKNITTWPAKQLVESGGGLGTGKEEYQVGGMNLEDLRGIFYIYMVCMGSMVVLFMLEVNVEKCGHTAARRRREKVGKSVELCSMDTAVQ